MTLPGSSSLTPVVDDTPFTRRPTFPTYVFWEISLLYITTSELPPVPSQSYCPSKDWPYQPY